MVWPWSPPFVLKTVILTLVADPDSSLKGVVWQMRGDWIVLRTVELLKESRVTPLDGEVIVHRRNVNFIQVVPL